MIRELTRWSYTRVSLTFRTDQTADDISAMLVNDGYLKVDVMQQDVQSARIVETRTILLTNKPEPKE